MHRRFPFFPALILALLCFSGCAAMDIFFPEATPEPTIEPTATPIPTPDPAELQRQAEREARRQSALEQADLLILSYRYDDALALLSEEDLQNEAIEAKQQEIQNLKDALVPYEGELRHIFFHSLVLYPELVYRDTSTPMGGYNAGFSTRGELEKMLPQLYERGYVLYNLNDCYEKIDGQMQRKEILLPEGKIPLILSVDDVAYAYGDGFARKLFLDENGQLMYEAVTPSGEIEIIPDGDVMGVVSAFVAEHPDFSWQGHKGTIALTGFQGAFGYPNYETEENCQAITRVANALKADGWNFASHSYTHNSGYYGFWGSGCIPDKIHYDINKWWTYVTPCLGETNLFIAPFGYRAYDMALQHILDLGFNIYCTVDDKVVNELYDDYALMSRIEIGGYSMTHYPNTLNELFFDVASVFDDENRPPVIG